MKKVLALILVAAFALTLVGCGQARIEELQRENAELRAQVVDLQNQLDAVRQQNDQIRQILEGDQAADPNADAAAMDAAAPASAPAAGGQQ